MRPAPLEPPLECPRSADPAARLVELPVGPARTGCSARWTRAGRLTEGVKAY